MTKASDNLYPKLLLDMQTSSPAAPSNEDWKLYAKANGIYARSSNSEVGPFGSGGGSVATDTIWDAAGDLVQGTGADTAAKLSAGTAGYFLKSGGAGTAVAWAARELDYVEYTSGSINVTATAAGSATTIITGNAVSYDGSTAVIIEFYCPDANWGGSGNAGDLFQLYLYDGSSEIGWAGILANQVAATAARQAFYGSVRLTPSNASHTYSWRGTVTAGARPIALSGGAGGSGARWPMYIRITRAL